MGERSNGKAGDTGADGVRQRFVGFQEMKSDHRTLSAFNVILNGEPLERFMEGTRVKVS